MKPFKVFLSGIIGTLRVAKPADLPSQQGAFERVRLIDAEACYGVASPSGPPSTPSGITFTGINGTGLTAIITGNTVTVAYDEPTTLSGGGALTDLQKTTISYQLDSGSIVTVAGGSRWGHQFYRR